MDSYFNNFHPLENDNEIQMDKQLAAFFHDKRGGYIKYASISSCTGSDEKRFMQGTADKEEDVTFFAPEEFFSDIINEKNCYVSLATFQKRDGARDSYNVFNQSILYFDIDTHAIGNEEEMLTVLRQAADTLTAAYDGNVLPIPTMINFTGRGFGIFYILERSINDRIPELKNTRLAFKGIYSRLLKKYQEVLKDVKKAEVDTAVMDKARLVRVAGTLNPNSGTRCRTIFRNEDGYGHMTYVSSLDDLGKYVKVKRYIPSKYDKARKPRFNTSVESALKKREETLSKLIEMRKDEVGQRHMTLFIAYQTLAVIYNEQDAFTVLKVMNNRYTHPLSERELMGIVRSTKRKKPCKYTNRKIQQVLNISAYECRQIGFMQHNARKEERARIKAKHKKEREERNQLILEFVDMGFYSYAEIALRFGVSKSLVKQIVAGRRAVGEREKGKLFSEAELLAEGAREREGYVSSRKDIIRCYMSNPKRRNFNSKLYKDSLKVKRRKGKNSKKYSNNLSSLNPFRGGNCHTPKGYDLATLAKARGGTIFCHLYICAMSYRSVAMVRPSRSKAIDAVSLLVRI